MAIGIIAIIGTIAVAVGIGEETVVVVAAVIAGAAAGRTAGRAAVIAGRVGRVQVVIGGPEGLVAAADKIGNGSRRPPVGATE